MTCVDCGGNGWHLGMRFSQSACPRCDGNGLVRDSPPAASMTTPDAMTAMNAAWAKQAALELDRARYAALVPPKLCPDPKDGTREGWAWCAECAGIKEPGHHHGAWDAPITLLVRRACRAEDRAEFAESLLCAMAFDHERELIATGDPCARWEPCVFCEAAR